MSYQVQQQPASPVSAEPSRRCGPRSLRAAGPVPAPAHSGGRTRPPRAGLPAEDTARQGHPPEGTDVLALLPLQLPSPRQTLQQAPPHLPMKSDRPEEARKPQEAEKHAVRDIKLQHRALHASTPLS